MNNRKGKTARALLLALVVVLSLGAVTWSGAAAPLISEAQAAGTWAEKEKASATSTAEKVGSGTGSAQAKLQRVTELDRIAGANRFETAVKIAERGWPEGSATVILARGDHFADCLSATPLAAMNDVPILLTESSRLTPETRQALQKLKPETVLILGGKEAVSSNVEYQLKQMGIRVERLSGNNRYETAAVIAERVGLGQKAIVVNGERFPDALSISSYAAQHMIPIVLTKADQLPEESMALLGQVEETIVVGGETAVSQAVFAQLPHPRRIAGQDRYETAVKVIEELKLPTVEVFLAAGQNYADALTGSVLAAKQGAPMLLVDGNALPKAVLTWMKSKGIHFGTVLGGPQAVGSSASQSFADLLNEEVRFADPALEQAIRISLSKPKAPLTRSDLGALRELVIFDQPIKDLKGLEMASNLISLELSFAGIKDISLLKHLTQLEYLVLWGNQIEDISPLSHLEKLTVLDLDENKVRDLSPIQELKGLLTLFASMNQIEDLSPLENLSNLTSVSLEGNQIEDLSALDNKESLMLLNLANNRIKTVPKLNLPNLIGLSLAGNHIADLTPLKDFDQLMELYLDYNRIKDISPLAHLTNLVVLSLMSNQIEDLGPVQNMTNLLGLYVGHNRINDLSPLSGLPLLMELSVSHNRISDLSPLDGMNQLAYLDASGNQLSHFPSLELSGLIALFLDDNQISNISSVGALTNLMILTAAHNEISDISALKNLKLLQMLDIHQNRISSLEPVRHLDKLGVLDASQNMISDISPLENKMMPLLFLSQNRVKDLSPLKSITDMEAFLAANNDIEDIAPLYEYVMNGGLLMLGDVRGNRLDLSEGSEQKRYVEEIEAMGIEFYYLPQQNQASPSGDLFDEEAERTRLKEEWLKAKLQNLKREHQLERILEKTGHGKS
jgi:internalin A